jgi:hypothetical protein
MKRITPTLIGALWLTTFMFQHLGAHFSSCYAQGDLTPPGAPAPMMKSLDQIEARIPVDATHTPGDPNYVFIINQPGSYYLTTNLVAVTGKSGIEILANNVFLDLNGYSLIGNSTAKSGIVIFSATQTNIVVKNGSISGWGVNYNGIESNGRNVVFERLTVSGNTIGMSGSHSTVIRNCIISGSGLVGISLVGSGGVVADNELSGNNTLNIGGDIASILVAGSQNRIEGNHVSGSGISGFGIRVSNNASYTNNLIIRNSVIGGGLNNYFFNANQFGGPLITNAVSGVITNLNPWANFSF